MQIQKLISTIDCLYQGDLNSQVSKIKEDSRKVQKRDIFITHAGVRAHAIEAQQRGASAILSPVFFRDLRVNQIIGDTARSKKDLIKNLYKETIKNIKIIGITGTDGKTTTSMLTNSIINESKKSASIGTLGVKGNDINIKTQLTTPQTSDLLNTLNKLYEKKYEYAVIECSSHGLFQDRIDPIKLKAAAINRVTRDHLDFHGNQKYYFKAKSLIFSKLNNGSPAIINSSSPWLEALQKKYPKLNWITWGREKGDVVGKVVSKTLTKSIIQINLPERKNIEVETNLVGDFQIENILTSISLCYSLGFSESEMVNGIYGLKNIPGRMQKIKNEKTNVFIDYAHTPNAIKNSIQSLKKICKGRVFAVFGCGGDRDKGKRPEMMKAGMNADKLFITSDNPRTENPDSIIKDMLKNYKHAKRIEVEKDRKKAIASAIQSAKKDDVVLIAGKGHEEHQIIGEVKKPHNDLLFAKEVLASCA